MKLKVSLNNLQDFFEEFQSQTGIPYQVRGFETSFALPQQFGKSLMQHWHLRDGLELYFQTHYLNAEIAVETDNQHAMFGLCYCVAGTIEMTVDRSPIQMNIRPGTCLSIDMNQAQSIGHIPAREPISLVEVAISSQLLHTLIAEEIDSFPIGFQRSFQQLDNFYWQQSATTPATNIILHQILNCPYQGATQQLYLESKVLELVIFQLDLLKELHRHSRSDRQCLKADDLDRIYQARDILIQNLHQPPSLLALAHQVGLNDYKLKQGFRQVFGTTVFGCLHQYRMEQARQLLETKQLHVEIAAHLVGYASLSSFHRAYKKYFGVNPGTYRQIERSILSCK